MVDRRHDPTFKTLNYYAAIIPAKKLDKWVNRIPKSNPIYKVPSAAITKTLTPDEIEYRKKRLENRKERCLNRIQLKRGMLAK